MTVNQIQSTRGFASGQGEKALPFRSQESVKFLTFSWLTVRQSLTALGCGKAAPTTLVSSFPEKKRSTLAVLLVSLLVFTNGSFAQTSRPSRNGAHSAPSRDAFTAADRRAVERAIGATCTERI